MIGSSVVVFVLTLCSTPEGVAFWTLAQKLCKLSTLCLQHRLRNSKIDADAFRVIMSYVRDMHQVDMSTVPRIRSRLRTNFSNNAHFEKTLYERF